MKRIIKISFAALMLVTLASCSKEPQTPTPGPDVPDQPGTELNQDLKFTLSIVETLATSAKIQVKHNGTTKDTWYAFATDSDNWEEALSAKITELTAEGNIKGLKKQKDYTYNVNALNPETKYTFIVFGITEDGITFGTPGKIEFTTKRGEAVMAENQAWTVAYTGNGTVGGREYKHTISVTSTDNNKYFITAYDKATFESYDIKVIAQDALAQLKEVVAYYQQQPGYEALTVQDMLFEGDGIDAFNLVPGDWYGVAVGVDEYGELSGLWSAAEINIPEPTMTEHPAWTVAYNGKATIGEVEYDHTVTVTSTDNNKYFITAYEEEIFEANSVYAVAEDALAQLREVVAYYQQQPGYEALTIQDMLFEGNGIDAMNLIPGDWYGLAIGVDENGELSGLYAKSPFNIAEEEATEAYSSWIGNWTFTGANGVSWPVTINKGINNEVYYLSGWEGSDSQGALVSDGIEIPMRWDEEKQTWEIFAHNFGTFNFGQQGSGDIWVTGAIGNNIYPGEGIPICTGQVTPEGNRIAVGYSETDPDTGEVFAMEYMMYIAELSDGFYTLSGTKEWPTFPLTITPREETAPASVETGLKGACKYTLAPKSIRNAYRTSLNSMIR